MCGIVVGLAFGKKTKKEENIRQNVLRVLTTELLLETESRGRDAVGTAILFGDGNFYGIKRGEQVGKFIHKFAKTKEYYGGFLKVWKEHNTPVRVYLGHCRAATYGDKKNNVNNHPIKIGNLVGIHNGTLRNHEEIFKQLKCKRDGEVDSEAIFRLFEYFTRKGTEPFTMEMIQEVVRRLEGQFAVTLFNADNLKQVPVFRDARPVEFVLIKSLGILLMVSELKFWDTVWPRYERLVNYYQDKEVLPTLIKNKNVITKTMPDDTAVIFDLDTEVTEETDISDLGESKKMERTNKIWKSTTTTTTTTYGYGYAYRGGSATTKTGNKKETDKNSETSSTSTNTSTANSTNTTNEKGKRRVFDNILKKYIIKVGDKVLDEEAGAIIDIDSGKTIGYEIDTKAEVPGPTAVIDDKTSYSTTNNTNGDTTDENVVDAETVEVKTEDVPIEIREAAELAYRELPSNEKGFSDDDDLMDKIEIANENILNRLGPTIIANRVYKYAWKKGFEAAAMEDLDYQIVEKSAKRTKYIEQLKKLVIAITNSKVDEKSNEHEDIDKIIDKLQNIFNIHELETVKKHIEVKK